MKKSKKEELYVQLYEQSDSPENIIFDSVDKEKIEFASLSKLIEKLTTTSYIEKCKWIK
jgi:hypothetical protein